MMNNDKRSIERLCELLDERNIEYGWDSNSIYWDGNNGVPWTADLYFGSNLSLFSPRCTPEQVIETTLGRGTCKIYRVGNTLDVRKCSACGKQMHFDHPLDRDCLHYCPNCGRKVVD